MSRILAIFTSFYVLEITVILPFPTIGLAQAPQTMNIASSAFQNGAAIPDRYTCSGRNLSPPLEWRGTPAGTRSLALIVDDPDAPGGIFVHWVVYNLSPNNRELPEGASASTPVAGSEQGINGRGETGYTGPCPPAGKPHHYHFRLFALDQRIQLGPEARAEEVEDAIKGHLVGETELIGIFAR